jgi:hypothetical protein
MSDLLDLTIGQTYRINRRFSGIPDNSTVSDATLIVRQKEQDTVNIFQKTITTVESGDGYISDDGANGILVLYFDLSASETGNLSNKRPFYYKITYNETYNQDAVLDEGLIYPVSEITDRGKALSTNADGSRGVYSARVSKLIDEYLDTIIHDFRQLRVWDEHARRTSPDTKKLVLTYQNWNTAFEPEVFNGNNESIKSSLLQVDYENGYLIVENDDGNQDYFITYETNLFPANQLKSFLDLTLMEINSSAQQGTYLTNYPTIDATPENWDAALVFGAASKVFKRLQSDGTLWKNFLIWQDGQGGQALAGDSADYYNNQFNDIKQSLKMGKFISKPGSLYNAFLNKGFLGAFSANARWRSYQVSRASLYYS